jgi:hypothetical protein
MGRLVVVPNHLSAEIYRRLDAEIEKHPDAAPDREHLFQQLLDAFDRFGVIPDFSLSRATPDQPTEA